MKKIAHSTFLEELKIIGIKIGYCSSYDQIFTQNEDNFYLKPIMKLVISFEMEENIIPLKSKRYMKTFMHSDMSLLPAVNY